MAEAQKSRSWRRTTLGALGLCALLSTPAGAVEPRHAYLLMDSRTSQTLAAKDPDATLYPASLTKMMTLYLAFESVRQGKLKLETPLEVSRRAAAQAPSKLGLTPGEKVPLRQLILGLTVQSANDAAVVVAEAIGGDETRFADLMTRKARALGMSRTTFKNASGLPNRAQVTSARDMATLGRALLNDFPQEYKYFSVDQFTFDGRIYRTHNRLLAGYDGADGIKTGYIRDSGFNLVASAERDGRRLIGVVFGGRTARSRDLEMRALLDRGFSTPADRVLIGALPRPRPTDTPRVERGRTVVEVKSKPRPDTPSEMTVAAGDGNEIGSLASEETTGPREWGVQIGAFDGPVAAGQAAIGAADLAPDLLGAAEIRLLQVRVAGRTFYRARIVGLAAEEAEAACAALEVQKRSCSVVKPSGAVNFGPVRG
jgi:D-alanyl-D-alanine carboxypeptidase